MAQVEILSEAESTASWLFDAQVLHDDGSLTRHRLRLSWADYNLWSADGSDPPDRVAEAVMQFLLSQNRGSSLAEQFDASLARRLFTDADERIPRLIR